MTVSENYSSSGMLIILIKIVTVCIFGVNSKKDTLPMIFSACGTGLLSKEYSKMILIEESMKTIYIFIFTRHFVSENDNSRCLDSGRFDPVALVESIYILHYRSQHIQGFLSYLSLPMFRAIWFGFWF